MKNHRTSTQIQFALSRKGPMPLNLCRAACLASVVALSAGCLLPTGALASASKTAAQTSSSKNAAQPHQDPRHGLGSRWRIDDPKIAFEDAKLSNKPVLLYWGAVWCPPCNELKKEVFSKPEFDSVTKNMVLVYLDGDSSNAQVWGDKLKVSGYPSVLLLNSEGKEITRFMESVPLKNLNEALEAASKSSLPLPLLVDKLRQGKGTPEDWKVASSASWDDSLIDVGVPEDQLLSLTFDLFQKAPATEPRIKSVFAAQVLTRAASAEKDLNEKKAEKTAENKASATSPAAQQSAEDLAVEKTLTEVRLVVNALLGAVFFNSESLIGAKNYVLFEAENAIPYLAPVANSAERNSLQKTWLAGAAKLSASPEASIDNRLWSVSPAVAFELADVPKDKQTAQSISAATRDNVITAVRLADLESAQADKADRFNSFARKSVISGAGSLLADVYEFDRARELLQKELKNTNTPWYIQSSLASVEKKAGNTSESLEWLRKASVSAVGDSTKLQWTAAYLGELASRLKAGSKIAPPQRGNALFQAGLDSYYETAFSTTAGFNGRNFGRQKRLAKQILDIKDPLLVSSISGKYARRCDQLAEDSSKQNCKLHFNNFTTLAQGDTGAKKQ